MYGLIGVAVI